MLMLKINKNLTLLHPKNAAFFNLFHFSSPSPSSSSSSSAISKTLNPPPDSNSVVEYLINSCGLSSQKAATVSKNISKFTSAEHAASVRHFFKCHDFDDNCIRRLISTYPRILSADVDKTLKPNLQTLRDMGFANDEVLVLIASNPQFLVNPLAIPRLEFWQNFLGTNNRDVLVRVFGRTRSLITQDIVSGIAPKTAHTCSFQKSMPSLLHHEVMNASGPQCSKYLLSGNFTNIVITV